MKTLYKMKNRLIPLSERWEQIKGLSLNPREKIGLYDKYVYFTGQNLADTYRVDGIKCHSLNRFVPCDLEGNVLEEPKLNTHNIHGEPNYDSHVETEQYQQAKDRVLFEGWRVIYKSKNLIKISSKENTLVWYKSNGHFVTKLSIEQLYNSVYLTPMGAKMCGKEFEK